MKQSIKGQATVPDILRALYVPIAGELEQVENILYDELRSDHPFVDQLVKHGFRLGGKRLRPALLLLAGKACGLLRHEHFVLGAVVELIHTATLIHDDVLDEATIRRHLDTINARWDNEASVLLGDYLFARSICLASTLEDHFATKVLSATAKIMCEGELRQIENRGNYNLREEQYISIIGNKTAELMGCCCRLGAYYADANYDCLEALRRYGFNLGMAFQIADDLLDLLGDENTVGKSLGTDLHKQKATLPLIRLLDQASPSEKNELVGLLSDSGNHRLEMLRKWFEESDAISHARNRAVAFTRSAAKELAALPAGPALDSLQGIAEFVVNRQL
ncbi:MAG: polyprenyl synthetase family protein [Thermoguttaceae bacterium]|jgi:octaprenyl-diphosphate synthase